MLGSEPSICPLCSGPEARKYQPWRCCSGLLLLLLLLQGSEALQQLLVVMVTVINTPMGLIRDFPSGSSQARTEYMVTRPAEVERL